MSWSGRYSVAAYAGGVRFYRPLLIGHLVEVQSRLIYTGRTSMHIAVHVRSADPKDGHWTLTTHCLSVFVAVDDQGCPTQVQRWEPMTEEDKSLERHALRLVDLAAAPPSRTTSNMSIGADQTDITTCVVAAGS